MNEARFMKRCLELAALGAGHVSPNPMVGCLLVRDGRIVGEGWHRRYGEAHAEVNAIADAEASHGAEILRECTLYVNLEPCSHYGKTPPCADLIIRKGIPRVVIGCVDTYAEVCGRGIEKLRTAGVDVQVGLLEEESLWLNRRFFTFHRERRPYIILKWAQTSDGFLDACRISREVPPAWMTGPACRRLVHRWRSEEDAILVGTRTAVMDDPSLTVRDWKGRNPLRITMDRTGTLSRELALFDGKTDTLVFTENTTFYEKCRKVTPLAVDFSVGREEVIRQILCELAASPYRIQSLIVEGGAQLLQSFIDGGFWDEARIFTAPISVRELYAPERVCASGGVPAPALTGRVLCDREVLPGDTRLRIVIPEKE